MVGSQIDEHEANAKREESEGLELLKKELEQYEIAKYEVEYKRHKQQLELQEMKRGMQRLKLELTGLLFQQQMNVKEEQLLGD